LPRVKPSGRLQQDRFGVPQRLAAHLLGRAGDHTYMGQVDFAGGEGFGGAGSSARRRAWRTCSQAVLRVIRHSWFSQPAALQWPLGT